MHDKTFLTMEDANAHQKVLRERAAQLLLCVPATGLTGNVLTKHKRLPPVGYKVATPLSVEKVSAFWKFHTVTTDLGSYLPASAAVGVADQVLSLKA
ncbi:hypothetical protein [Polaromonas sp. DSR2-3-2]|uniref:hypothetical protein n=1 Tax=unclassified Polaromonas TaxID=2638319 RepID=UPI003CF553FB